MIRYILVAVRVCLFIRELIVAALSPVGNRSAVVRCVVYRRMLCLRVDQYGDVVQAYMYVHVLQSCS